MMGLIFLVPGGSFLRHSTRTSKETTKSKEKRNTGKGEMRKKETCCAAACMYIIFIVQFFFYNVQNNQIIRKALDLIHLISP